MKTVEQNGFIFEEKSYQMIYESHSELLMDTRGISYQFIDECQMSFKKDMFQDDFLDICIKIFPTQPIEFQYQGKDGINMRKFNYNSCLIDFFQNNPNLTEVKVLTPYKLQCIMHGVNLDIIFPNKTEAIKFGNHIIQHNIVSKYESIWHYFKQL